MRQPQMAETKNQMKETRIPDASRKQELDYSAS